MPWFCGSSKKRHNKSKVSNISTQPSANANVLSNGRPSFSVVLQDFNGSVADELSARRGEVLEALFSDREWIYVRDINGKCGYVPQTFCYPLDAVGDSAFQKTSDYSSIQRPRPKSLQLEIAPVNQGSQNSVSVNQAHEHVNGQVKLTPVSRRASMPPSVDGQVKLTPVSRGTSVATTQEQTDGQVNLTPVSRRASVGTPLEVELKLTPVSRRAQANTPDSLSQTSTTTNPQRPTHQRTLSSSSHRNLPRELIVTTEMSGTDKQTTSSMGTPGQTLEDRANASPVSRFHARRLSCPQAGELSTQGESFQYTPYSASRKDTVKRSVSMNDGAHRIRPRVPPVNRTLSYREAVHSTIEQLDTAGVSSSDQLNDEPVTVQRLSSNDSPRCTRKNCDCSKRRKPNSRRNRFRRQSAIDYDSDDVFLPNTDSKKPFGIFRCNQDHQPTIEGEVALKKNELVIVLDYGRGEWAWIITSHHIEGLVPKRILTRYDADRGANGVKKADASTQTELIVSGAVRQVASSASTGLNSIRQVSTASNASMGTNAARQVSSASSASGPSVCGIVTPVETISSSQSAQTAVVAPSSALTVPSTEWFCFTDSLERPSHTPKPSTQVARKRFPESAPVTPISPTARQLRRQIANADRRKSFSSRALSSISQRGTPVLTAAKDYDPPETSKNCLTLKKGDVLTPQSHMHYPKGWMWVWHSEQKRFGYVPNGSVAYNYPVTRNNRTATVEDEV